MIWLDSLLAIFRKPAPAAPAAPAPVAKAPPLEETVETPAVASPAWYPLCEALTKASEGCVLVAYADPASGGDPWTCGYGATGEGIARGTVWTQARADARLTADLLRFGAAVDKLVTVPLSPQQKAALVDFAFNVGTGSLGTSTLLKLLNGGDYAGAADQFDLWVKASGKTMAGLVKRRARERSLFLTGVWS
ncbi:lysozyme [Caballeronia sp. LZ035]|uniref:lysozyme n=1 Tax=Caballeronia sp. LZ035 TaxID=3038568 RepID=UPI0028657E4D|nr:lysozyme [Caballeronia sp. LZ035]MDR5757040.1 lysozyme [Caballeronia sp. LZ035]